ncbi:MAG: DNA-directed RNA polymerase [Methanomicrobia archaeon]|nr:DNA-directed RNA polymerase [Methanomicrobia archaeon]RLF94246.1 MAG: DNA-directed RNA polymerase [Thermococci archaeon]RLF95102.1 MAG: DNA-directed RNA polymerase [Thermococci archaeon]HDN81744.1 DNA-directed RNA polymerase [Methanomicrobia archaeon]
MYKLVKLEDIVRIPPDRFSEDQKEVILDILREQYEGKWDKELGMMLCVQNIIEIGEGRVIHGDGASYNSVIFDVLTFLPKLHEIVEGHVVEIVEFGVFVRIGPVDALSHVSQITNDYISYDKKQHTLTGKETKQIIKEGDYVRARIVTLGTKEGVVKVGLTMRQPYLGKFEWISEEKKKEEKK